VLRHNRQDWIFLVSWLSDSIAKHFLLIYVQKFASPPKTVTMPTQQLSLMDFTAALLLSTQIVMATNKAFLLAAPREETPPASWVEAEHGAG